jgi:antitoxin component of MazEF toxin-antitoxin module|tara:strand:- start:117 stop:278 length:162 start_codon:yes stop_codon:yes gene_type:complete
MGYEKFYGKLWRQGASVVLTIPEMLVKGAGLNEGEQVVVMIQKKGVEDERDAA